MSMTLETDPRSSTPTPGSEGVRPRRAPGLRVAVGGLAVAAMLLGLNMVMRSNAEFAEDNVRRQLSEQRIVFTPVDKLTPEERRSPCLVRNASKPLTTGAQAECYANHYIGRHLKGIADGRTYAEMREVQVSLRSRIADAQARNDPAVADLQRQLNEATAKRQTLFEGETVRGLLLSAYGFSTLGTRADQAATVSLALALAVTVLSLALLVRGALPRLRAP